MKHKGRSASYARSQCSSDSAFGRKCPRYPVLIALLVLAILVTPFIAEAKQGREDVPLVRQP